MRGKHVKVKSLLEDEDVQHEVLQYLRTSKFGFYLVDFVRYVSDNIFPRLGISRLTPIGYETFYLSLFHACITYILFLSMHIICVIDNALIFQQQNNCPHMAEAHGI